MGAALMGVRSRRSTSTLDPNEEASANPPERTLFDNQSAGERNPNQSAQHAPGRMPERKGPLDKKTLQENECDIDTEAKSVCRATGIFHKQNPKCNARVVLLSEVRCN